MVHETFIAGSKHPRCSFRAWNCRLRGTDLRQNGALDAQPMEVLMRKLAYGSVLILGAFCSSACGGADNASLPPDSTAGAAGIATSSGGSIGAGGSSGASGSIGARGAGGGTGRAALAGPPRR